MAAFLDRVVGAGLKLKPSKMRLDHKKVPLLGRVLSAKGVRITEEQRIAIMVWPRPANFADLTDFVAKVGWVKEHVPGADYYLSALRRARFDDDFNWLDSQEHAFNGLKQSACCAIALVLPSKVDDMEV
jgi:hypothetical protein